MKHLIVILLTSMTAQAVDCTMPVEEWPCECCFIVPSYCGWGYTGENHSEECDYLYNPPSSSESSANGSGSSSAPWYHEPIATPTPVPTQEAPLYDFSLDLNGSPLPEPYITEESNEAVLTGKSDAYWNWIACGWTLKMLSEGGSHGN